ncbi:MAG: Gfo/Idh/MocA family oxidoreductase [Oscillospiraceae bacterium]|nr:Gfo/Idh/MocA family oxidoreductase [Oscillospiraceae bacterium]
MAKVKIGVFGAGRGTTMMNQLYEHPDAELVAVCDKYVPALEEVRKTAEEKGAKVTLYERFEDFIRHDMDAVVLANYATEHAIYAVKCLNAGKHVMSEVLPCENIAQGVELIEAVERTGLVYTYAENYCYMDRTFEMWRRYKNGDIGEATYGEGEYIHDCLAIWPLVTYGERDHWRNRIHPFFYCTHSLGPLMAMTGLRPVKVTGFGAPPDYASRMLGLGLSPGSIEMVEMENGAVFKSIHGGLKREPGSINYELYGKKGCMETQRYGKENLNVWMEGDKACEGTLETYIPEKFIEKEMASRECGHDGSDFYATHFFVQKILGRPQGEWAIDVYQAVSMGICGILAYRSFMNGGVPEAVPDLRDPAQRDKYRNDRACTTPEAAGDQLIPMYPGEDKLPPVPDEAYERVRRIWEADQHYENEEQLRNLF